MEQRIIQYVSYLKGIYLKEYDDEERKKICEQVLVQLIPYIRHYYILENSVQTMYRCYDKLSKEAFHEVPKKGENI